MPDDDVYTSSCIQDFVIDGVIDINGHISSAPSFKSIFNLFLQLSVRVFVFDRL